MLALLDQTKEPFVATDEEALIALDALAKLRPLAAAKRDIKLQVFEKQDVVVPIPARLVSILVEFLEAMTQRRAVSLIPCAAEITTKQAADFLNVSRPYLVRLVDAGAIPARMVGTHRRILMSDLMEYKKRSDEMRKKAIRDMVAEAQKLKLP